MPSEEKKEKSGRPQTYTIEQLERRTDTPSYVTAGAQVRYGWTTETRLAQAEFERQIKQFLGPKRIRK